MEILEGDALNRAVAEAEGWRYQEIGDGLGWWVPPPNTSDILPRYVDSADLTWAVVDGLREKGWRILLRHHGEEAIATMYRGTDVRQAFHLHRNTAILNACLLAMEVDNGE